MHFEPDIAPLVAISAEAITYVAVFPRPRTNSGALSHPLVENPFPETEAANVLAAEPTDREITLMVLFHLTQRRSVETEHAAQPHRHPPKPDTMIDAV